MARCLWFLRNIYSILNPEPRHLGSTTFLRNPDMTTQPTSNSYSLRSIAILILVITSLTTGCNDAPLTGPKQNIPVRLSTAKVTWESLDLHTYSYGFRWRCYCNLELQTWRTINVVNDVVVSVSVPLTGRVLEEHDLSAYLTVPQLFDFVSRTQGSGLEVRFDQETGIPYDVFANHLDRGFEVRNFVVR